MEHSKIQRRSVQEYEKMLVDHVGSLEGTTISINSEKNTKPCW
ncbi:hypothetical protein KJE20_08660 [Pyrenophora tritici-repentis]|nr:hypothetical protein KJE20_08660 [Pyrenophora tritici-repentis]